MNVQILLPVVFALAIGAALGGLLGYYGKCSTGTCPLTSTPKRGALYGLVLAALFAVPNVMSRARDAVPENSAVVRVKTVADLEQQIAQAQGPVLVDFGSPTCPPCRKLGPVIEKLADQYKGQAVVAKVNVNDIPELAQRYGISSIPAVILFSNGQETQRIIGYNSKETYTSALDKLSS
jgi:thioredoxin 1